MAQAMCVERAPDTLNLGEHEETCSSGGVAAFTGHVMITLCFRKVKEEAGNSKSLLDAVHGDGITGRLCLGVPHKSRHCSSPALGWSCSSVQHPGLAGRGPRFSGAIWICKSMREHSRTDVGTWKSQGDTFTELPVSGLKIL